MFAGVYMHFSKYRFEYCGVRSRVCAHVSESVVARRSTLLHTYHLWTLRFTSRIMLARYLRTHRSSLVSAAPPGPPKAKKLTPRSWHLKLQLLTYNSYNDEVHDPGNGKGKEHQGKLATKVRYFGVKSTKVFQEQMGI